MVDAEDVKRQVNLLGLVSKDSSLSKAAKTGGGEYAGPCPFCGGEDRFRVQKSAPPGKKPQGARWLCRKCSPQWGDVIGYVQKRHNYDFQKALAFLGELAGMAKEEAFEMPKQDDFDRGEWLRMSEALIAESAEILWTAEGAKALAYLRKRGLADDVLRDWRIGFNPEDKHLTPRGVVIPCQDEAGLHYVKIRRSAGTPKYKIVKGGEMWPFGLPTFRRSTFGNIRIGFLFEAELDALLAIQTGLDGIGYAALPAGQVIQPQYLPYFYDVETFVVAADNDEAGQSSAAKLCKIPGFHQAQPFPSGKDLTEFSQNGGDVLAYLLSQLELTSHGDQSRRLEVAI
jgi:DNA primase